jgi:DNA repair protein RadC
MVHATTLPLFSSSNANASAANHAAGIITRYGIRLVKETQVYFDNKPITCTASVVELCTIIGMHEQAQEEFHVFHLNTKHQVTGMQLISRGTLNASLVHPREVFKGALLANAYALILAHNHPSGNTEPSNADKQVTTTLINASKLLDIHILDHLIIGSTGTYFSFRESGLITS